MRTLSALALVVATAAAAPATTSTWKITVAVFEGTIEGFFNSSSFPSLEACASDTTDAYNEIQNAITEIEQKTPASVLAGIKDLGKAFGNLKAALTDCKTAEAEVAKLAKALENGFEHPLSFLFKVGKALVINGHDIFAEMSTAISDWKAGSYRDAGLQIGEALAKLLVPTFEAWQLAHGKTYASAEEEASARAAFLVSTDLVHSKHMQDALGAFFHLNEFADLSPEVFNRRNGYVPSQHAHKGATHTHKLSGFQAPTSVDWRTKGLVADVKNQGSCGSCWAFSTIVSIEGQHAKKTGAITSLSEQNLVDCVKGVKLPNDTDTCCMGCQGGLMDDAFSYVLKSQSGAIDTEAGYPYRGLAGTCAYDAAKEGATIGGWTDIPQGDEAALLDAVATVGPVSIAVDAGIGWQLYFGGIMHATLCSSNPKKMDHGVAIVGFGTEGTKDYWIVRNSWGKSWGEHGYARILRGKNACGLANAASYPTSVASTVEA